MNWRLSSAVDLAGAGRISPTDARRQTRTAAEILRRFDDRPGIILADEVGMGKTYVALAVAVSALESSGATKPVVVMVPASVQDKWPSEWEVFHETCVTRETGIRATRNSVRNGAEFLKLLDDPISRRQHLIFLTHGALTSSLADPYIKLAIVRRALNRPSLGAQRKAFPRWAGRVLNWFEFHDSEYVNALLSAHPRAWASIHRRTWGRSLGDQPVPDAFVSALKGIDLRLLIDALRGLPLRASSQVEMRLAAVREQISAVLPNVWQRCLTKLDLELPLVILDEAHHLKNPRTRLAGLFANPTAEEDVALLQGPFGGVFDRMLFLTATPFQLGHYELVQVLRRFAGVRWRDDDERGRYEETIDALELALDDAQRSALRLDSVWSRLAQEDLDHAHSDWWGERIDDVPENLRTAAIHFQEARRRLKTAERHLKPWVIRHARGEKAERRNSFLGRAIITDDMSERNGLQIEGEAVLPFLLAARLQAMMAAEAHAEHRRTHAYFADGLASSFQAYRETRRRDHLEETVDDVRAEMRQLETRETHWYMRQIDRTLPIGDQTYGGAHPKIAATASRAVKLWADGEKVLIFCFYIATGRALRAHISHALRQQLLELGAERLGLRSRSPEEVGVQLQRFANRFFDPNAPVTKVARDLLASILSDSFNDSVLLSRTVDIALRFVRTPSFLVRYVDVGAADRADAFQRALEARDVSGRALNEKIRRFGTFVSERVETERVELLGALEDIQTGTELAPEARGAAKDLVPNVRLANGEVARDARRRLMLAFNTPFFPEVLIASAVMAEGVDLHLDCRFVIHHDLDWNPSVLEQRTGRLDRLGSKSELTKRPIHVYEPFLEATQDEKQFLVVKDRERWFNVVMGERLELDEWTTDRLAERVPLPPTAADELAFRLEVVRPPKRRGLAGRKTEHAEA